MPSERTQQQSMQEPCQTLEYATLVCQLYQSLFPHQESWRFQLRIILSIMDQFLGPDIPQEQRKSNNEVLIESGLIEEILKFLDYFRDRERFLQSQCPVELGECETLDQVIQVLHRPKILESIMLVKSFVFLDDRLHFPSIWRRLWGGSVEALHMNMQSITQPQAREGEENRDDGNDNWKSSLPSHPKPSGFDRDVWLLREPDTFDILGSILYPGVFDAYISDNRQASRDASCSDPSRNTQMEWLPSERQGSTERPHLVDGTELCLPIRRRSSPTRQGSRRRRASNRALTRGPPLGRHHRRILAAQAAQQTQSRVIFLRALIRRTELERRSRTGHLKGKDRSMVQYIL
ncbi:uncharacterized protein LY89DRAFT_727614 [Mollisia scopiformis]|uniref:Uncharacterized protein n=1 Tax=Mollisia scopiformis TaxID=149040 RepID=A0A194XX05_MOLSC|nr:uncharacterized protein LY89DRAFT_727614 [Mollisia scopiformis]KUJ24594.1 hypothetical protein LY89DRAFT_727614 [Mollisia scopiformis]